MRKLVLIMAATALMVPATAMGCPSNSPSSISVTCQQGVKVYRGTPLAHRRAPAVVHRALKTDDLEQRLAMQEARLDAQTAANQALQAQLDAANKPKRRARYGTTYYGSPFLFGNTRSYGRRSYIGSGHHGRRGRRGIKQR